MLCISLFQAAGVEILIREIDISPRNPTRRATCRVQVYSKDCRREGNECMEILVYQPIVQ